MIPAFENGHGQGYQALIMVDNSQGHSAYGEDALLTSRMNLQPGGKQARLQNGWYMQNGERVAPEMIFPHNHREFPDQPKGMKQILVERGLWKTNLVMECKNVKERVVNPKQKTAVQDAFLIYSQTFRSRNPLFRKSSRQQVICASFCRSFTVS